MLFEVDRVTYRYQQQTALRDLSLTIAEGTRVALLGANGSGKSTLLRLLDGLYFPDSGEIRFRGDDLIEEHFGDDAFAYDFRRQVGLVFQNPDVQLFNPTVFDEVAFGPLQLRWKKAEVRDRVAEILDRLRIFHLKDRIPHRLSGGEKKTRRPRQRARARPGSAAARRAHRRARSAQPQPAHRSARRMGRRRKSVITATHDLRDLEDIADRCYVLDAGQLAGEGRPRRYPRGPGVTRTHQPGPRPPPPSLRQTLSAPPHVSAAPHRQDSSNRPAETSSGTSAPGFTLTMA